MVSKIGAKEFKKRVKERSRQIDKKIKDEDLYFSQTLHGYYIEYSPNYPNSSDDYFLVHQDLVGCISVHGNYHSLYPGVNTFENISDFEDDTNYTIFMSRDEMIDFIKSNPNIKITHDSFTSEEYIYSDESGKVYTEDGKLFEDWNSNEYQWHNGIRARAGESWESGWSLYKE